MIRGGCRALKAFGESTMMEDALHISRSLHGRTHALLDKLMSKCSSLAYQHFLWREHLGYNLHPSIDLQGRQAIEVADVGTGNW